MFRVLSPTRALYLDLIVNSERTPESSQALGRSAGQTLAHAALGAVGRIARSVLAAWGVEAFSSEETSVENDMSVVQFADHCGKRILLTGDAGRTALTNAATYLNALGIPQPNLDRFQVPHHGSRRNVSTELLDFWLRPRLPAPRPEGQHLFETIVNSALKDTDHPRKAVVRAMIHRGGAVFSTEGKSLRTAMNAPPRNWTEAKPLVYPIDHEE